MPRSDCSALHGVNLNSKKKQKKTENFTLLMLRILKLIPREVCKFLKK